MNKLTAWGVAVFTAAILVSLLVLAAWFAGNMRQQGDAQPIQVGAPLPSIIQSVDLTDKPNPDSRTVCKAGQGDTVAIVRAERLPDGLLYLLVDARGDCRGWLPAHFVANNGH